MKELNLKEALKILEDMKVDIPVPKAAVTQRKRNCALDMAIKALKCSEIPNSSRDLISSHVEQLTDTEQRIFLAAMGREEKVCKQVDEECRDCREPYEDSLVRICHEIVRKVKGALWMI